MNKDLMEVTTDLARLLKRSKDVSEKEKSKVDNQLSQMSSSRGTRTRGFLSRQTSNANSDRR